MLGEALGDEEELFGRPFVGASGRELRSMCLEAGLFHPNPNRFKYVPFNEEELAAADLRLDNVFMEHPKDNKLEYFCASRKDVGGADYPLSPLLPGNYVRPEFFHHLRELDRRIVEARPNLIVALGNTAIWFLLGHRDVSKVRGYLQDSPYGVVLPTYHPAAVLRNWSLRPVVLADLMKAREQSRQTTIQRPERELWIEPTLQDIEDFYVNHYAHAKLAGVDIETEPSRKLITCIGFSADRERGICIPFTDTRKHDFLYWERPVFRDVLRWVHRYLRNPIAKVTQNGMYDFQWVWEELGMVPRNWSEDTMLAHWSYMPEMSKGLDFLGSIYTGEAPWKYWRKASAKKDG